MTGSNDQFKLKTEQDYFARLAMKAKSEYTLRNLTRLPSTGSGPEHVEGSRSTLSFSTKSPSVVSSGLKTQGRTTHDRRARRRLRFACFKIDKAERHQDWTFDVGCSMFDVQSVFGACDLLFPVYPGLALK
jgi:hypothetical protein